MSWFWNGWSDLGRIVVIGVLGYLALIVMLRVTGNRTLSKMNSFDFIITVALGSTTASGILSKTTPLASLIVALGTLILLQYVVTWLSVRSPRFEHLVKTEPTLLFKDGHYLYGAMKRVRVTKEEVQTAARNHGLADMSQVRMAVLESDGTISCL